MVHLPLHYSPYACVVNVCLHGGTPYIILETIAKTMANLMQTFENLLLLTT